MHRETLETDRLLLKALTPEIYDQVFSAYSKEELKDFFGCSSDADLAEEKKKWQEGLSMYRKSLLIFQIIEKESSKIIGWCGFHTWYVLHFRAEIGYVLSNQEQWGKGYMKEALAAVLHYGFTTMGLKRVEAFVGADNAASLRLLNAWGFVQEGVLREHYYVNGTLEDSLLFSLLERDYHEQLRKKLSKEFLKS